MVKKKTHIHPILIWSAEVDLELLPCDQDFLMVHLVQAEVHQVVEVEAPVLGLESAMVLDLQVLPLC